MIDYGNSVKLTEKSEVKSVRDFLDILKKENLDYSKVHELIRSKFPNTACEFHTMGEAQVLCINEDYNTVYKELEAAMIQARKFYSNIDSDSGNYWYDTNRGNTRDIDINIDITNRTFLYGRKYNCKTAVEFFYNAGFKSSRRGWDGRTGLSDFEIVLHQNTVPVVLHVSKMMYYTAHGVGSNFREYGYHFRSKYLNVIWFDDCHVSCIFESGNDSDYLWVLLESHDNDIPYAFYQIDKEDILKACNKTRAVIKDLNKLQSKLVEEDFVIDLNDNLQNLKADFNSFTNDAGEIIKEIVFFTNNSIPEIEAGVKFITIKQEHDDYMYRFNGQIGKESLSYNRPITTDFDIKESIEMTISMIQHSPVLKVYIQDLHEIYDSL